MTGIRDKTKSAISFLLNAGVRGGYNIESGELWVNPKLSTNKYNAVYEHEKAHENQAKRWPNLFAMEPYLAVLSFIIGIGVVGVAVYYSVIGAKVDELFIGLLIILVSTLLVLLFPEYHAGYVSFKKTRNIGQLFEFMLCPLMVIFLVLASVKLLIM